MGSLYRECKEDVAATVWRRGDDEALVESLMGEVVGQAQNDHWYAIHHNSAYAGD